MMAVDSHPHSWPVAFTPVIIHNFLYTHVNESSEMQMNEDAEKAPYKTNGMGTKCPFVYVI
jgi:hypothetical protein